MKNKINLFIKILILIILSFFLFNIVKTKKIKYIEKLNIEKNLKIDLDNKKIKINDLKIYEKNEKEKNKIAKQKLEELINKFDKITMKNDSELKKIVYIFSNDSLVNIKDISEPIIIYEKEGYILKYIHFKMDGSLNEIGKFLYLLNKSKKYIDTSKSIIEISQNEFKISIGYLTRKEEK